jgi:steroid delta-isomerase-like uncharacterized protein
MPETPSRITARVWDVLWSAGDLRAIDELIADGYVRHPSHETRSRIVGRAGFAEMLEQGRAAFPDLVTTIDDQIEEGDKVTSTWTSTGTHTGAAWREIEPAGAAIRVGGITISRIEHGQIAEEWAFWDESGMRSQLGG